MKDHEIKLMFVVVFAIVAAVFILDTPKEIGLLVIITNILFCILIVLNRILNKLKD